MMPELLNPASATSRLRNFFSMTIPTNFEKLRELNQKSEAGGGEQRSGANTSRANCWPENVSTFFSTAAVS